jgi:hypothetical protein
MEVTGSDDAQAMNYIVSWKIAEDSTGRALDNAYWALKKDEEEDILELSATSNGWQAFWAGNVLVKSMEGMCSMYSGVLGTDEVMGYAVIPLPGTYFHNMVTVLKR